MKRFTSVLLFLVLVFSLAACSSDGKKQENKEIAFADAGWDSIRFHNAVAGTIINELYGYTWSDVPGSTTVLHEGLVKGEIDIHMEVWTNNITNYDKDLADGKLKELGVNFDDNYQGIYVPRYVIEGDAERGIEALAPDLKTIWDLKNYPEIFPDDDHKNMGRMYGGIPGWEVDEILNKKYYHYGLDENFVYFRPGSDAALSAAITSAYEKGEPIAAYYWEPTWLLGKYDMVLLEDEPYNEEKYNNGETELPPVRVTVGMSNDFAKDHPELIDFLSNYKTSSALTSEGLAYMQDNDTDYMETAKWFLSEHPELIDEWLNQEDAQQIKDSLTGKSDTPGTSWIYDFPFQYPINQKAIDDSVRGFSVKHSAFFDHISNFLGGLVNVINLILDFIPWFVLISLVFLVMWRTSGKISKGVIYSALLSLVGVAGLWSLMNETLSIVIASVIISLVFGFPIGILLSTSDRLNRATRPILDTMQTMPVFVYLIPALLFFGLGKPPAVIATTIYAIVPIIRLTNLGIREINPEIVEASMAFGSTKIQSLLKVQVPQALPTIMTGVNQTIMMAMAMVVTTSMIGASGLGMEVLIGVNRVEIGRGLVSGSAVVIIAVILDRATQGLFQNDEVK